MVSPHTPEPTSLPQPTVNARQETLIVYIAFVASIFFSLFASVIGVIYAYVRRNDLKETVYYSHFNYLIRLFWWQLGLSFVPMLMISYGIVRPLLVAQEPSMGWLVAAMAWGGVVLLWFLIRLVLGLVRFQDARPIHTPLI
ncbi:MAG: hypothetical protein KA498_03230 [Neisseriaceae bacterium]|nr:hypothetical protein [Neisseriaceae bacterium]